MLINLQSLIWVVPPQSAVPWRAAVHCVYLHSKSNANDTRPLQNKHTHTHTSRHIRRICQKLIFRLLMRESDYWSSLIPSVKTSFLFSFKVFEGFVFYFWSVLRGKRCWSVSHFVIWTDNVRYSRIKTQNYWIKLLMFFISVVIVLFNYLTNKQFTRITSCNYKWPPAWKM